MKQRGRPGRNLRIESLEDRRVLAITFAPQAPIVANDHSGPTHTVPADLDGDGDFDLVTTSYQDGRLGWYANVDGQGNYGELTIISENLPRATMVRAADFDGDNDLDIVASSAVGNKVSWFQNLDGRGSFGEEQLVTDIAFRPHAIEVGDLDGDGDVDVLSTSSDTYDSDVSWYKNDGAGNFGAQEIISVEVANPFAVATADLDGDGDLDVMTASYGDNKIAWYENEDGKGTFGDQRVIADDLFVAIEVIGADLDNDGDIDVVGGGEGPILWYENLGNTGNFGPGQLVVGTSEGVETLDAADLDNDGDLDLISASAFDGETTWFENLDGQGSFGAEQIILSNGQHPTSAIAADLDGDGDLDLPIASYDDNRVLWFENVDGRGSFTRSTTISTGGAAGVEYVDAIDIDGDGDLDALSASQIDGIFAWYENLDGQGTFGTRNVIDSNVLNAIYIRGTDLDGDGDADVLVAIQTDSTVAWYENVDGNGSYSSRKVISNSLVFTEAAIPADIDGDGDVDVVAVSTIYGGKVVWFENNGSGNFGREQTIGTNLAGPKDLRAADFDADGDLDLLVSSINQDEISWFENTDGNGNFGTKQVLSTSSDIPLGIDVGDIDGDSHLDIIVASFNDNELSWMSNTSGTGDFSRPILIAQGEQAGYESVELADFDNDGDLDIVAGSIVPNAESALKWYENLDGQGNFSAGEAIEDVREISAILAADLDNDGRLDLLAGSFDLGRVNWYRNETSRQADFNSDGQIDAQDIDRLCLAIRENDSDSSFDLNTDGKVDLQDMDELIQNVLGTSAGDANLDGVFNSSDLVAVFRVGEYEDAIPDNSSWADGDWNCDGEFNSRDIVAAFQAGRYVAASPLPALLPKSLSPDTAASLEFWFQHEDRKRQSRGDDVG